MGREKLDRFELYYRRYVSAGGTLPTARTMAELADVSVKYARHALRRLGLDYHRLKNGKKTDDSVQATPIVDDRFDWSMRRLDGGGSDRSALMQRVLDIQRRGDAGKRPDRLPRPGEEHFVADRMILTCPVCGSKTLIAPRMHPYWLRDAEGNAIFVCRPNCMGRAE